jgi:hypothetical protein
LGSLCNLPFMMGRAFPFLPNRDQALISLARKEIFLAILFFLISNCESMKVMFSQCSIVEDDFQLSYLKFGQHYG